MLKLIEGRRTLVSMFGEDCILKELAGAAPNSSKLRTREKLSQQRKPLHSTESVKRRDK